MTGAGSVVGRLAPSPTGLLHLGHARTFLLAWWSARAAGGRVLLRIEDLDAQRSRPELERACLEDLAWLGLDWDGPAVRQSERREVYGRALAELVARRLAYPCVCTRRELERAASAPHADDGTRAYPGTCRGRFADEADARARTGRDAALRLRVAPGPVRVVDALAGERAFDVAAEAGDFPLRRRDGVPAYQLAVAVDDALQGVTEVVRGDDLLPSAARQELVQRALGLASPRWVHVPLVVDPEGRRFAKRTDDLALAALRERGVDPRAVVGWAARSAEVEGPEHGHAGDYVAGFDLARVPRSPCAWTGSL